MNMSESEDYIKHEFNSWEWECISRDVLTDITRLHGYAHVIDEDRQHTVSIDDYEKFKRVFAVWYRLAQRGWGEAFCHHFNITDIVLESYTSQEFAEIIIEENYLQHEKKVS